MQTTPSIVQEVDVRYFPRPGERTDTTPWGSGDGDGASSPMDNRFGRGQDSTGGSDSGGGGLEHGSSLGFMPPNEGRQDDYNIDEDDWLDDLLDDAFNEPVR